jgi:hypothetical protein
MDDHKPMGGGLAFALITFGVLIDLIQAFLDLLFVGIFLSWALDAIAVLGCSMATAARCSHAAVSPSVSLPSLN